MIENQKIRPAKVIGPLGEPLTLETLPPPSTTRWVVRRKAEVVAAVNGGLLSVDEVCDRYGLTVEEFAGWQRRSIARACRACASPASSIIARSTSASRNTDPPMAPNKNDRIVDILKTLRRIAGTGTEQ